MPSARRSRSARPACALVAALGALALAAPAEAGDKPFSSGLMLGGNSLQVTTTCNLLNVGAAPVTFASVFVLSGPNGQMAMPPGESCTTSPLLPGAACTFGSAAGVYGGGLALIRKGNPKNLRGNCRLVDGAGITVQMLPMR